MMTCNRIQRHFFCGIRYGDMIDHCNNSTYASLFDVVVPADQELPMSKRLISIQVVQQIFDTESGVNEVIKNMLDDEDFRNRFPSKASRYHVFKDKKSGDYHIEEQLDLFDAPAVLDGVDCTTQY